MHISRQTVALYLELHVGIECDKPKCLNLHQIGAEFNPKIDNHYLSQQ